MTGRPTVYNEPTAEAICRRLSSGESLRSICRDDAMPAISTVLLWVVTPGHAFSEQYRSAREAAGYAHADRIVDVADQAARGEIEPNAAKAVMHGLMWAAERMAPKVHTPRQEITGANGDPLALLLRQAEGSTTQNRINDDDRDP